MHLFVSMTLVGGGGGGDNGEDVTVTRSGSRERGGGGGGRRRQGKGGGVESEAVAREELSNSYVMSHVWEAVQLQVGLV